MKKLQFKKLQSYVLTNILMLVLIFVGSSLDVAAQTRIRFARGSSSASLKGTLSRGSTRTYVLGARSGQYISANLRSSRDCVVFDADDTTSYADGTNQGDNYLTIRNTCGGSIAFTMVVSIDK